MGFSCIDWHERSRAPATHYSGDRVRYEGHRVFKDTRIGFVNSVFNSVRRSSRGNHGLFVGGRNQRGVFGSRRTSDGSDNRGSHSGGIQTGLPYTGRCVYHSRGIRTGLPYTGLCGNMNSCVDRANRVFSNTCGSYGSIGVIFQYAWNLQFSILPSRRYAWKL